MRYFITVTALLYLGYNWLANEIFGVSAIHNSNAILSFGLMIIIIILNMIITYIKRGK